MSLQEKSKWWDSHLKGFISGGGSAAVCQSPSERLANHSGVYMASQNLDAEAGRIVRPTQATQCPPLPSWSEAQPTRAQADGTCFCLQGRLVAELRVPHVLGAAPSRRPPARAAAGPEDGERGPVLSGESWSVPPKGSPLACV